MIFALRLEVPLIANSRHWTLARKLLAAGTGINKVAKAVGLSNGTVARVKAEMAVT
jgi:hypothetical protein